MRTKKRKKLKGTEEPIIIPTTLVQVLIENVLRQTVKAIIDAIDELPFQNNANVS